MRTTQDMNIHPIDGGTSMTILSIGLYTITVMLGNINVVFGQVTLQGIAGFMAILAAFSTVIYNCYRFYNDYKKNNQIQKKE